MRVTLREKQSISDNAMQLDIDERTRRRGRFPHELAMVNLLVINLLLCAGIIAGTMARKGSALDQHKLWLVAAPLAASLAVIAFTWRRAVQARTEAPGFVATHWNIALKRYFILAGSYLVAALFVALGWLLSQTQSGLQEVMFVALVRVAVAPMLIAVMVCAVLESSALAQAGNAEAPDGSAAPLPSAANAGRSA